MRWPQREFGRVARAAESPCGATTGHSREAFVVHPPPNPPTPRPRNGARARALVNAPFVGCGLRILSQNPATPGVFTDAARLAPPPPILKGGSNSRQ